MPYRVFNSHLNFEIFFFIIDIFLTSEILHNCCYFIESCESRRAEHTRKTKDCHQSGVCRYENKFKDFKVTLDLNG